MRFTPQLIVMVTLSKSAKEKSKDLTEKEGVQEHFVKKKRY
jgi:hypothetical protein